MNNLYDILGVASHVTPEVIKSAYKARARECHPDKKTGSKVAFQELNEAYSILKDPEKRRRYDAGESLEDVPEPVKVARSRLADMFAQAIEHAKDDKDMVEVVRASIVNGAMNMQQTIDQVSSQISNYEHVLTRVEYSGPDDGNIFSGTVNQKIDQYNNQIEALTKELELVKIVTELLNDYECEVDKLPAFQNSCSIGGVSSTGWYP